VLVYQIKNIRLNFAPPGVPGPVLSNGLKSSGGHCTSLTLASTNPMAWYWRLKVVATIIRFNIRIKQFFRLVIFKKPYDCEVAYPERSHEYSIPASTSSQRIVVSRQSRSKPTHIERDSFPTSIDTCMGSAQRRSGSSTGAHQFPWSVAPPYTFRHFGLLLIRKPRNSLLRSIGLYVTFARSGQ
jgi:hypothetical protein